MCTVDLGWVNISCVISGVSEPKFAIFLFNAREIVVDNAIHRLSISLPISKLFATEVKSCCKSHQILDIFALPNFKGTPKVVHSL